MLARLAVVIAALAASAAACSVADIPSGTGADATTGVTAARGKACIEGAKDGKLEKQDTKALAGCACEAGGAAHCLAKSKVPGDVAAQLASCDEGVCVPDRILDGKLPTTCSARGREGRCLSLCVPNVAKLGSALGRGDDDVCESDERCVPCADPRTGEPTGVCDIGNPTRVCGSEQPEAVGKTPGGSPVTCPFTGEPMDLAPFPVCAPGGRCVERAQLEAALGGDAAKLVARLLPCATGLCVPEEYIAEYGQHKPKACSSFAGIEGRCFSTVFKDVAAEKDLLRVDACGENERCVPCFNPADGEPTGACATVACDAPSTPKPSPLPSCCGNQGKCVPRRDVPTQFQENLDDCGRGGLCVPTENLDIDNVPIACTPTTGGEGACISDCIDTGFLGFLVLAQGTCPPRHTCAPCVDPTNGRPTGAPGCH